MRHYIRHPAEIPLHFQLAEDEPATTRLEDVSTGGLSFASPTELSPGQMLDIRIDIGDPPFVIAGRVVWCQPAGDHYRVGVCFRDTEEAFSLRMVEQICHIQQYRERVRQKEGRELSPEEAAREWIERHAGQFPAWDPGDRKNSPPRL